MYELRIGFKKLKALDYDLKILVCDESMGKIAAVAKEIYPKVIIQYCLRHYSVNLDRKFKVNHAKRKLKSLEKVLRTLGDSILISTRHHDRAKAIKIVNEISDLEFKYGYLIETQFWFNQIFWHVSTESELTVAEDGLNLALADMNLKKYPYAKRIINRYHDYYEKWHELTAFIRYPQLEIPKTSNLIEGFNSTTLELRLNSIRGFEKETYAKNYINALILQRRFQKFTDCKGKFKHLNGKSPLEISRPLHISPSHNLPTGQANWGKFCLEINPRKTLK